MDTENHNHIIHCYIYYRSGQDVVYDRTISSCRYADERVRELQRRGKEAWWTTDVLRFAFY